MFGIAYEDTAFSISAGYGILVCIKYQDDITRNLQYDPEVIRTDLFSLFDCVYTNFAQKWIKYTKSSMAVFNIE